MGKYLVKNSLLSQNFLAETSTLETERTICLQLLSSFYNRICQSETSSELTQPCNGKFTFTYIPPIFFVRLKMLYQKLLPSQYFENLVTVFGREDMRWNSTARFKRNGRLTYCNTLSLPSAPVSKEQVELHLMVLPHFYKTSILGWLQRPFWSGCAYLQ